MRRTYRIRIFFEFQIEKTSHCDCHSQRENISQHFYKIHFFLRFIVGSAYFMTQLPGNNRRFICKSNNPAKGAKGAGIYDN
jgi:hypothetical protein